jgi:predicted RNA-binding protein YlxR (DUF448 family)
LGRIAADRKGKVAKKPVSRVKHIPQRTCVGCRRVLEKKTLIRLVRTPDGVVIDLSGKLAGRGAYLHENRSCWEKGLKGSLANALKTELTEKDRDELRSFLSQLPDETESTSSSTEVADRM